jgi:small subunit ribosomal protein S6
MIFLANFWYFLQKTLPLHLIFKNKLFLHKNKKHMLQKQYETVFILTPVLSDAQAKETVEKFKKTLVDNGAEITHEDAWGLRKLAYPIQNKSTGYYQLFEFTAPPTIITTLETDYKRDERVIRYLTTSLDKYAVDYNERRHKGLVGKKKEAPAAEATTETLNA